MVSKDFLIPPGQGRLEEFRIGESVAWKVTGSETNGAFDLAEFAMAPLMNTGEHVHSENDELFYILGGRYRFKVEGVEFAADPGSTVYIPKGTPHAWVSDGPEVGRTIIMFSPGGMDGYFRELAALRKAMGAEEVGLRVAAPDALAELNERYGYKAVGPRLT